MKYSTQIKIIADFPLSEAHNIRLTEIANRYLSVELARMKKMYEREHEKSKQDMLKSIAKTITGAQIRQMRIDKGWSQEEFARKMCVGKSAACLTKNNKNET